MTERRILWTLPPAAVLLALLAAGGAEGAVVFSSSRCEAGAPRDRHNPFEPRYCRFAIWRIEDDGSGLRPVTDGGPAMTPHGGGQGDESPSMAPDGSRIVFVRFGALHTVKADGTDARPIKAPDGAEVAGASPDWAPDGTEIVFERAGDIYAIRPDGTALRPLSLTPDAELTPEFTQDGLEVTFVRWPAGGAAANSDTGLFSVSRVGLVEHRLSTGDLPIGQGLSYSPDGRYLAFAGYGQTYTMREDGAQLRRVPAGEGAFGSTWIPAGPTLLYSAYEQRDPLLYRFDVSRPDLGAPRITDAPARDFFPDWSPAGGSATIQPLPDRSPPAVQVTEAGAAVLGSRRHAAVRRSALRLLEADRSGLGRLELAVARRSGRRRCRFLGARRFSRPRSCRRPIYRRLRTSRDWRRRLSKLRPGAYTFRFRTSDVRGNAGLAAVRRVRIRR